MSKARDIADRKLDGDDLTLGDNDKAIFGDGSDLQIYHDGSHSYINDQGTGSLILRGTNGVYLQPADGSANMVAATAGGAVTLYHNDSNKLATTSTGVDVTGTVTADGVSTTVSTLSGYDLTRGTVNSFWYSDTDAVLLGSSSSHNLFVKTGNSNRALFYNNGDIGFYEDTGTTAKFFWDASAERLGIGTSSPVDTLHVEGKVIGADSGYTSGRSIGAQITAYSNSADVEDIDALYLRKEGNNGSSVGIAFGNATGNSPYVGARIKHLRSGSNSNGHLVFETKGDGSFATTQEAMRIDSSGNLLVGQTSADSSSVGSGILSYGRCYHTTDGTYAQVLNRKTSDGAIAIFQKNGSTVGSISVTGSSTSYNTSSDYRLKEDWQPMQSNWERVQALKPVNFAWKTDGSRVDGFLAHEVQEVVPEAVTGTKDAMRTEEYEVTPAVLDEEGNVVTEAVMGEREVPDYQGIDQSKLVPLLTAALQDAITKIEELETRLNNAGI